MRVVAGFIVGAGEQSQSRSSLPASNWARAPSRDTQERGSYKSPLSTGAAVLMSAMIEGVRKWARENGRAEDLEINNTSTTRGRIRGEDPFKWVFLQVWGLGLRFPQAFVPSALHSTDSRDPRSSSNLRAAGSSTGGRPGSQISARPRLLIRRDEMNEMDLIESRPG